MQVSSGSLVSGRKNTQKGFEAIGFIPDAFFHTLRTELRQVPTSPKSRANIEIPLRKRVELPSPAFLVRMSAPGTWGSA